MNIDPILSDDRFETPDASYDSQTVYKCDNCGGEICDGDEVVFAMYCGNNLTFCTECAYTVTAEVV